MISITAQNVEMWIYAVVLFTPPPWLAIQSSIAYWLEAVLGVASWQEPSVCRL